MKNTDLLKEITEYYLDSPDFNGISCSAVVENQRLSANALAEILLQMIDDSMISVLSSEVTENPHINRVGFPKKETQKQIVYTSPSQHTCLYPHPAHLATIVDHNNYRLTPYRLCLALGAPQLKFVSFDLSILEIYRNDPRYHYDTDSISGKICVKNEYYLSDKMEQKDQVLLETFGFSYDTNDNRAVASFLRYLSRLSPEHQQIWKAKELGGDYKLHPIYFDNTILGKWSEGTPIFKAFATEIYIINKMAIAMDRPKLFKKDFGKYGEGIPHKFNFLIRPTLDEYNSFTLLLDKAISDNINMRFFQGEINSELSETTRDGKIVTHKKGSLRCLDEWIRINFDTKRWDLWDESIKTLRSIRKQRQKPAHAIEENVFDQLYFKLQRDLIIAAYKGLRTIRLIFANHPLVKRTSIDIPKHIFEGRIIDY